MMVDKHKLLEAVRLTLEAKAEAMRASVAATHEAATHEEARPENDKDTRGLEASYLARGQAMRVEELEEAASRLRFIDLRAYTETDPIGLGALVTLATDETSSLYFLVPVAGGTKIAVEGVEVQLVTPAAPLGRALIDKLVGDDFTLRVAGREREYEIEEVA